MIMKAIIYFLDTYDKEEFEVTESKEEFEKWAEHEYGYLRYTISFRDE
jgi:hypothetical protein